MGDEGLIKDRERAALAESGHRPCGRGLAKGVSMENFLLYLAMTRAEEYLTISYAGSNDEGEGLESSLVIKRLQSLGFCTSPIEVPFTIQDATEDEYLWRPYQSLSLLSERWGCFV